MCTADDEFPTLIDDAVSPTGVVERGKYYTFAMPTGKAKQTFILMAISGGTGSMAKFAVVLEGPPPPPEPPVPPTPPTPPVPPAPVVGPFGVLILENPSDRLKNKGQTEVIESIEVRNYMTAKCEKEADGKTAKWRVWKPD
jgi:hypothetical protein